MRKNILLVIALVIGLTVTGCSAKDKDTNPGNNVSQGENDTSNNEDGNNQEDTDNETDGNIEDTDNESDSNSEGNQSASNKEAQAELESIRDAVAKAYGDDYIPNMPYETAQLKEIFGIEEGWYDAIVAEGPMISVNVDTFLAIHPTEGNLDNVKNALEKYKDFLVNESLQYPMNIAKVQAASVVVAGDNVYFVMLGFIDDNIEDDAKRLEAFEAQNQIAIDVINSTTK